MELSKDQLTSFDCDFIRVRLPFSSSAASYQPPSTASQFS